jgi:hypothetical protein
MSGILYEMTGKRYTCHYTVSHMYLVFFIFEDHFRILYLTSTKVSFSVDILVNTTNDFMLLFFAISSLIPCFTLIILDDTCNCENLDTKSCKQREPKIPELL